MDMVGVYPTAGLVDKPPLKGQLLIEFPDLVTQWHTKNGAVIPDKVVAGSGKKYGYRYGPVGVSLRVRGGHQQENTLDMDGTSSNPLR